MSRPAVGSNVFSRAKHAPPLVLPKTMLAAVVMVHQFSEKWGSSSELFRPDNSCILMGLDDAETVSYVCNKITFPT